MPLFRPLFLCKIKFVRRPWPSLTAEFFAAASKAYLFFLPALPSRPHGGYTLSLGILRPCAKALKPLLLPDVPGPSGGHLPSFSRISGKGRILFIPGAGPPAPRPAVQTKQSRQRRESAAGILLPRSSFVCAGLDLFCQRGIGTPPAASGPGALRRMPSAFFHGCALTPAPSNARPR